MTLLAPRLLISLRREYYAHVPGVDLGSMTLPGAMARGRQLSWQVRKRTVDSGMETDEDVTHVASGWSMEANQNQSMLPGAT